MKHHIGLTIDSELLKKIEDLRGREKRSTYIEHLIRLGLKAEKTQNSTTPTTPIFNAKGEAIE
jgi:metal-responsive CopG/Arc/MetJ family transcriptional regulator